MVRFGQVRIGLKSEGLLGLFYCGTILLGPFEPALLVSAQASLNQVKPNNEASMFKFRFEPFYPFDIHPHNDP